MNKSINPIENSLLQELVDLYCDDLLTETHSSCHHVCLTCAKQSLVCAISHYRSIEKNNTFDGGNTAYPHQNEIRPAAL